MKDLIGLRFVFLFFFAFGIMKSVVGVADLFESGFLTWDYIKESAKGAWNILSGFRYAFSNDGLFKDVLNFLNDIMDNILRFFGDGFGWIFDLIG